MWLAGDYLYLCFLNKAYSTFSVAGTSWDTISVEKENRPQKAVNHAHRLFLERQIYTHNNKQYIEMYTPGQKTK